MLELGENECESTLVHSDDESANGLLGVTLTGESDVRAGPH